MTAEQKARDMLDRMGVEDAQGFSAGDLVELANLIAARDGAAAIVAKMRADLTAIGGFENRFVGQPGSTQAQTSAACIGLRPNVALSRIGQEDV